jgi:hypothetical protein
MQSEALRGHLALDHEVVLQVVDEMQSDAVRGNQWHSEAISITSNMR